MTQWHPIFVALLRPLVEGHYEVQTGVPVGDAPRTADVVLLRHTRSGAPPFRGLWRWLTDWNVLEFKGPTVSARVDDLDALAELGLGIHRRLNEQRRQQRRPDVGRPGTSFWYLAPHLGRRFLRDAVTLFGALEPLGDGVWRAALLQRPFLLVSVRALPVDRDSVPLHVLARAPGEAKRALARVLSENLELWPQYGSWVTFLDPALGEEVENMAGARARELKIDWRPVIERYGLKAVLEGVDPKRVLAELGPNWLVEHFDEWLAQLTPEQRREVQRRLQEESPAPRRRPRP